MSTYPTEYVEQTRSRLDAQVAAFAAAGASPDLEPVYFNNLVLVLELAFVHRTRTLEKKDGNPLNEVRVLAASLLTNDGRLLADPQITLDPAKTVLGLAAGDVIAVHLDDFVRLAKAFFEELGRKFGAAS